MQGAKTLVVGAGGIGCELLKTLVLSGFSDLTVIDLDTIDKSNLNRQFLFKREDIGKSKATTAASLISSLRPKISISGLQINITSLADSFFQQFSLVFNALDNLEARRFVNRKCNFLSIPMIDAGTKGRAGQVTVHIPKVTSCYDCEPKATPKEYPVCTIRSTPSKPEHCIAWAKYLYEVFFGPEDPANVLSDLNIPTQATSEEVFTYLFVENLPENAKAVEYPEGVEGGRIREIGSPGLEELVGGMRYAWEILRGREKKGFCKNDKVAVQFIAAVSNIRALNFGIPVTETFKVEEIAGNIVPAIGSSNAIVSGLQVIQAEKLINNQNIFGTVWLLPVPSNNKHIQAEKVRSLPNPNVISK